MEKGSEMPRPMGSGSLIFRFTVPSAGFTVSDSIFM